MSSLTIGGGCSLLLSILVLLAYKRFSSMGKKLDGFPEPNEEYEKLRRKYFHKGVATSFLSFIVLMPAVICFHFSKYSLLTLVEPSIAVSLVVMTVIYVFMNFKKLNLKKGVKHLREPTEKLFLAKLILLGLCFSIVASVSISMTVDDNYKSLLIEKIRGKILGDK